MLTAKHKLEFKSGKRTAKTIVEAGSPSNPEPPGRLPRITKMMALAIRLDQLIRDGVVADQAELARLGHVSRARLTQIMDLLVLAPAIQEALLLEDQDWDKIIIERHLRKIASHYDWQKQRQIWQGLRTAACSHLLAQSV